jgi:hypothetical protein
LRYLVLGCVLTRGTQPAAFLGMPAATKHVCAGQPSAGEFELCICPAVLLLSSRLLLLLLQ